MHDLPIRQPLVLLEAPLSCILLYLIRICDRINVIIETALGAELANQALNLFIERLLIATISDVHKDDHHVEDKVKDEVHAHERASNDQPARLLFRHRLLFLLLLLSIVDGLDQLANGAAYRGQENECEVADHEPLMREHTDALQLLRRILDPPERKAAGYAQEPHIGDPVDLKGHFRVLIEDRGKKDHCERDAIDEHVECEEPVPQILLLVQVS